MLPSSGGLRLVRAVAFGATATGLAATAHVVGGGAAPGPRSFGLLSLAMTGPAALVAGRQYRLRTLLPGLLGSQVLLHFVIMWIAPAGSASTWTWMRAMPSSGMHSAGMHSMAGMAMTGMAGPLGTRSGGLGPAALSNAAASLNATMVVAHLIATLATASILAWGESALWALALMVLPRPPRTAPGVPHHAGTQAVPAGKPNLLRPSAQHRATPRRGPPARGHDAAAGQPIPV